MRQAVVIRLLGRPLAIALTLAIVLGGGRASALDPNRALDQHAIDVWREGLPQYMVRTIVQTRDGYLWLGTMEGLVRFNGISFDVFDPSNVPAMRTGRIRRLFEDRNGTLWIGTVGGGILQYSEGQFRPWTSNDELPAGSVISMMESRDGALWLGTGNGVCRAFNGSLTCYGPAAGLPDAEVNAIVEDAAGTLWLATGEGLYRRDGDRFAIVPLDGDVHSATGGLVLARDGSLWVGVSSRGILRIAPDRGSSTWIDAGPQAGYVFDLHEDRDGTIWAGTSHGGVAKIRDGRATFLDKRLGLPSNSIRAIGEDREGSIWIGTDSGLARLKDLKFVNVTERQGLSSSHVRVVTESRDGGLWVGTYGAGLNLLRGGQVSTFGLEENLGDLFIRTLYEDDEGDLWIGTDNGLARLHDGKLTEYSTADGLANNKIEALHQLRDGTLLVSTARGLQARIDGKFVPWLEGNPRLSDLRAILEAKNGDIWFATYEGIVHVRGRAIVRTITTRDGLPSNMVFALLEDDGGDLWIGTHEGLSRIRNGRIAAITAAHGLRNSVVFQILDDGRGSLWLTSNRGLTRVDKRSIDDVIAGRAPRIRAMYFGKADGLGSDQCNGATQPSGVRTRDGRLVIPTVGGLSIVDPGNLHLNRVPPSVVLRDVLVDGKPAPRRSNGPFPWSSRRYEFRYDGLSLLSPELVRFRYRVDGFDEQWIDGGANRVAHYNSLSPGRHAFRVIASNNDGVWSTGEATYEFEVLAAPWRRWWAFLLYALAAAACVTLAIRMRERTTRLRTAQLEAMVEVRTHELAAAEARAVEANRAKSVFLANMSHELRTPLNAILGFAQLLSRSRTLEGDDRESLGVIRRSGEHLLGLINDVLSISKIEAGKLAIDARPFDPRALIGEVAAMIRVRAEAAGLELQVIVDSSLPDALLGDAGKLRQILINLLGNAIKFTERGSVTLRASWAKNRGRFEVSDTGPGIDPSEIDAIFDPFVQTENGMKAKEGTGLGLPITRQLVRMMGGEISASSRPGGGSTFFFEIDMPMTNEPVTSLEPQRVVGVAGSGHELRILVTDDTDDSRVFLSRLLRAVGFEPREATDGDEAVDCFRQWRPGLIFIDQRMRRMNGDEATRRIRQIEADAPEGAKRTVIVAVTASAFEHERDALLENGADAFVMKPFTEDQIFELMRAKLGLEFVYERRRARRRSGRVLVVDDDAINRVIARELLERLGISVTEARSGLEALDLLGQHTFDAVLLDVEMPELDGRMTVRKIRARQETHDLPVIAMTAHDAEDSSLADMTDYVPKPLAEDIVIEVLSRYVELGVSGVV
ncbi:MAG: response regulator [Acidobacteria bacterium]|nr:response regulator [Acidobacteriota bacterium]